MMYLLEEEEEGEGETDEEEEEKESIFDQAFFTFSLLMTSPPSPPSPSPRRQSIRPIFRQH